MDNLIVKKLLLLLFSLFVLTACSKVVTDKSLTDPSTGQKLTVREAVFTFNFRGDTTNPNYKYYFVITTQNIFDNLIDGIFENFYPPEEAVTASWTIPAEYNPIDSVEGIYTNFYAKWDSYFKYERSDIQWKFYNGPFVYGQTITEVPTGVYVPTGGSQLGFKMTLSSVQPDFYFTLLTVYETNTEAKRLVDTLNRRVLIDGNTRQISESQNKGTSAYPGLDIRSFSVNITEY